MLSKIKIGLSAFIIFLSQSVWANLPYYPIEFPRDEAAHFENVPYQDKFTKMTEWWYFNGTLTSTSGKKLGYYLSFYYVANGHGQTVPIIQMQITDIENQKVYANQLISFDDYKYQISTSTLNLYFNRNFMLQKNGMYYRLSGDIPSKQGLGIGFELRLQQDPKTKMLLVGGKGLVDMWNKTNSYYYSLTKLITSGYITIGNEVFELDPTKSLSWHDHQWGDFLVVPQKNQWMWAGIQLKNGMDINLDVILDNKTKKPVSGKVSVIMPDDSRYFIMDMQKFSYTAKDVPPGKRHPQEYELNIPELNLQLNLKALAPDQDYNGIWEGVSEATGTYKGQTISGQAYTENSATYGSS